MSRCCIYRKRCTESVTNSIVNACDSVCVCVCVCQVMSWFVSHEYFMMENPVWCLEQFDITIAKYMTMFLHFCTFFLFLFHFLQTGRETFHATHLHIYISVHTMPHFLRAVILNTVQFSIVRSGLSVKEGIV